MLTWPDSVLASNFKQPFNEKLGIGTTFGRWPDGVVTWVYNPTGKPTVFDDDAYFVAQFQEALDELEGVSGLTFVQLADDPAADISDFGDGVVVVGWASLGGATAGQAGPASSCSGQDIIDLGYCQYVDGSVKFDNDGSTTWDKVAADVTERFFQLIATHELMHLVGIGHSEVAQSIMFANPYTNLHHPREDDINGLQSLYGEPDQLSQSPIYMPPAAGANPLQNSFFSLSDDMFNPAGDIDGSETATHLGLAWTVLDGHTDDLTFVVTDPHGFYFRGRLDDRDCSSASTCTLWTTFASLDGIILFPGVWTAYFIYNGQLAATESVTVTTNPVFDQAPDSTLTHDVLYGPAPLKVQMTLDVTGDNEGNAVDATWHIPTVGEIALDSGNFPGSAGTSTQTVTFDTPGEYEIYVEVNDDWTRYGSPGAGDEAGPGFRTLYRRVVRVAKVSDDVTTFGDVTGDSIPDVAAMVGGPNSKPQIKAYSGADGSVHTNVKYLTAKWRGIAIATVRDGNQDGTADDPAVALLADHDISGKIIVETRLLDTGATLGKIVFRNSDWRAVDVVIIDDTNGDGNTNDTSIAVLLQHRTNGKISLQLKRLGSAALVRNINALSAQWTAIAAAVANRNGQSPLIGVLAEHHSNGKRQVQSRLVSSGTLDRNVKFFNATSTVKDVTTVHDLNGDGATTDPAWQVLALNESDKTVRVQTRLVSNGSLNSTIKILSAQWEGYRLDSALDMNANVSRELAVSLKKRSNNRRRIHIKDFNTRGTIINFTP
jgi:hypothetical protein